VLTTLSLCEFEGYGSYIAHINRSCPLIKIILYIYIFFIIIKKMKMSLGTFKSDDSNIIKNSFNLKKKNYQVSKYM